MYFLKVLGPVQLCHNGNALPLRTHKALALLMMLALGGPSPRARAAAHLWPSLNESDARRNLRRELARLRQAGGADAVVTDGDTLALASGVACDAGLFETTLSAGRADAALAHWHGPVGDGLQLEDAAPFDDWLSQQRTRLAAQRRKALQAAAVACESAGDLEAALQRIEALLADDALQEAHHRTAMRLLALCGRREAALVQYDLCRKLLADELGLAPMAETEALAASLRTNALPVSGAPRASGNPMAWLREMPLVGRATDLARMQDAWAAGSTVLIEGPAGIGKTRLACDFAASQGAYALAQCRPGDRDVPYASFTRALRGLAGETLAQAGLAPWVMGELARVLPELGANSGPITSAEERRRFFEACAAAWQALAGESFDAVVIDDWHLADASSRQLFSFIARQRIESAQARKPTAREIFVFRPELDASAHEALSAMTSGEQVLHLRLQPLLAEQLLALVKRLSGSADPRRFSQRLLGATGGNPFFVAETLRHWRDMRLLSLGVDGVWQTPFDNATEDYLELPLPDSVRDAVLARVHRLHGATHRLLEAAALAAEPFAAALLAGACALSEVEALAAIEEAVQAELLREHATQMGAYAFAHDLVQTALDSALAPERRRLVHRRLALGAEAAALPPTEIARHWEAGGEPRRAVAHRIAAAEAALALYSDDDGERHLLAALSDQPTLAQQVQIHGQRWAMLRNRDDRPALDAVVAEFDRLREQALATPGAAEVALDAAIEAAHILSLFDRSAEALARIDLCLEGPMPSKARHARALMVRTQALNNEGRIDEAMAAGKAALAVGGMTPMQEGQVLHALIYSHFLRDQPQPALAYARRSLALWQSVGARRAMARAHANIGLVLGMLDDVAAAVAELEQAYAIASELNIIDLQRWVANNLADNHLHQGSPHRAIQVVREAWDLSPHFSRLDQPIFFLGMLVQAHYQLGDLGSALKHAEDSRARAVTLDKPLVLADCVSMALDIYTYIGDREGARHLIASLEGRSLDGLEQYRVKLAFNLVFYALRGGDVAAACAHLATVGEISALQQPGDRANATLRHAQVALAEGDACAALAGLAPMRHVRLQVEVWALACAVRMAAHTMLGEADAADLVLAQAALASGRLPALPALEIKRECHRAAQLSGNMPAAQTWQTEIAADVQRLAESLNARPLQREQFLRLWV